MLEFNLSEEEIRFLKETQERIKTQDTKYAQEPIFIVFENRRQIVPWEYRDSAMFVEQDSGDYNEFDKQEELMKFFEEIDLQNPVEDIHWKQEGYINQPYPVALFFTKKEADLFILKNKDKFRYKLTVFYDLLHKNYELRMIRSIFLKLKL